MRATSFAVLSAAALAYASPCTPPTAQNAVVVVEASHGGAGNDRTNTTITVPLGKTYVNNSALAAVSTLYLISPNSATCTPYKDAQATVNGGLAFTVGHPSLLSTNTVVVGSLLCSTSS